MYGAAPNHSECGGGCGAATCDVGIHIGRVASGVDESVENKGVTCGDGARSDCRSPAGSVDGIDAVSVSIGVAMLMWCGKSGVFGSNGALYQAEDTSTAVSWAGVVAGPSKSPNGLDGVADT